MEPPQHSQTRCQLTASHIIQPTEAISLIRASLSVLAIVRDAMEVSRAISTISTCKLELLLLLTIVLIKETSNLALIKFQMVPKVRLHIIMWLQKLPKVISISFNLDQSLSLTPLDQETISTPVESSTLAVMDVDSGLTMQLPWLDTTAPQLALEMIQTVMPLRPPLNAQPNGKRQRSLMKRCTADIDAGMTITIPGSMTGDMRLDATGTMRPGTATHAAGWRHTLNGVMSQSRPALMCQLIATHQEHLPLVKLTTLSSRTHGEPVGEIMDMHIMPLKTEWESVTSTLTLRSPFSQMSDQTDNSNLL